MDSAPAVLAIAIDPAALPVAAGVNVTFSAAVCPGVRVVLAPAPLTLKPAPLATTLEIVRFALPAFVSVAVSELLLPTTTLPKSRLLVLEVSSGVAAKPEPLVEITRGEFGASLASETDPVTLPAAFGVNTTLNVLFCPGAMLVGSARPDVENPAPVTAAVEIVTVPVPPFCKVMVCEPLTPIAMLGKLALVGVAESCGWGVFVGGGVLGGGVPLPLGEVFDPITTPAQPLPIIEAASTIASRHCEVLLTPDH